MLHIRKSVSLVVEYQVWLSKSVRSCLKDKHDQINFLYRMCLVLCLVYVCIRVSQNVQAEESMLKTSFSG